MHSGYDQLHTLIKDIIFYRNLSTKLQKKVCFNNNDDETITLKCPLPTKFNRDERCIMGYCTIVLTTIGSVLIARHQFPLSSYLLPLQPKSANVMRSRTHTAALFFLPLIVSIAEVSGLGQSLSTLASFGWGVM